MNYRYNTVFWDWNGTLFDDVGASLEAVNVMLEKRGLEPLSLRRFRSAVATPIIKFYREFFDVEKEGFTPLSREYHALYEELASHAPLAEGARELVRDLHKSGVRQIIASSSHTAQIEKLITRFGIRGYFDAVLGADDYIAADKLTRILDYMKKNSITPTDTVFIGDTPHDAETARAAGSPCLLALWGSKDPEELCGLGELCGNMDEVRLWLQ